MNLFWITNENDATIFCLVVEDVSAFSMTEHRPTLGSPNPQLRTIRIVLRTSREPLEIHVTVGKAVELVNNLRDMLIKTQRKSD